MHCFQTKLLVISYLHLNSFFINQVALNVNILVLMNKLQYEMFAVCEGFEIFIESSFATKCFNSISKLHRL